MRSLVAIFLDLGAVALCYVVAVLVRVGGRLEQMEIDDATAIAGMAAVVQVAGNSLLQVYRPTWPERPRSLVLLVIPAISVGALLATFNVLRPSHPIPYAAIPTAVLLSVAAELVLHTRPRWGLIVRAVFSRRARNNQPLPLAKLPNLANIQLRPDQPIREAIAIIERDVSRIALITDGSGYLLGVATDGDIRRAILAGLDLARPISAAMTRTPVTAMADASDDTVRELMQRHAVRQIPLLDADGRVVQIRLLDGTPDKPEGLCPVLIMAGGLGTRLGELTRQVPKPLMRIAGRPILEMLIRDLSQQGFRDISLAVNYKADLIEEHFGDGSRFGVRITYLREHTPLGTAGAIRLPAANFGGEFIVTNADLLTRVNFRELLSFHRRQQHEFTIAVIESTLQLRYGLIEAEQGRVTAIREKPALRHFVNAGIYVLEPDLIEMIPENIHFNMDELIAAALQRQVFVGCFPIHEYWTDVGEPEDLRRAEEDFTTNLTQLGR